MKQFGRQFMRLFGICCTGVIIFVIVLLFLSEKFAGAGDYQIAMPVTTGDTNAENQKKYIDVFEKLRNEYANIKTVELEADVAVDIFKETSVVKGNGKIKYAVDGNKYKYLCEVSENLEKEKLMRNVGVLYDENKFYFFDSESKIVSFQNKEEVRIPCALPNPFFLPLEFFSNDDDSCEGCKMRLQDVRMPKRWSTRASSISEVMSFTDEVGIHNLVKMKGGELNNIPYDYQVRFVGESVENMQIMSIDRVKEDGSKLAGIVLNEVREVDGISVKIPHSVGVAVSDETARVVLNATFKIKKLRINQPFAGDLLTPQFDGAESFWDSDAKTFVKK